MHVSSITNTISGIGTQAAKYAKNTATNVINTVKSVDPKAALDTFNGLTLKQKATKVGLVAAGVTAAVVAFKAVKAGISALTHKNKTEEA
ncbi:MAG: hypothetical protein A2287_07065 [Candidatus Melainabacteria bacterium RIFOXYA12_FULL_32_12]|nr:MAG: hypothetical protein A2287_07065 [Candidatus Melainabacteria bacterium RIFOXYA12_FULL_32_12]